MLHRSNVSFTKKNPLQFIVIDNYDSFTYNLVNQLKLIGGEVIVFRNQVPINLIFTKSRLRNKSTVIVISPGPGNPSSAGNSLKIIEQYAGSIPILGICLGHQCIIQHYGGTIGKAKQVIHGKSNEISFEDDRIFDGLRKPLNVARYHSLIATKTPHSLSIIARCNSEVMAVKHIEDKVIGFQFHPESILTNQGTALLESSIRWLTEKEENSKNINSSVSSANKNS